MKKNLLKDETPIKEIPFEKADFSVFDFETTGTSPRTDRVIEIGIVKIRNGKTVDTFQSYINPGRHVPYYITSLTGITTSDVENAPYFDEVYAKIKDFVDNSVLVAHNLNFDYSFLKNECSNTNSPMLENAAVCTLRLAKRLYPEFSSRSLGSLVKNLKIRHRNVHRGLGDAAATAKVLLKMFKPLREEHSIDTISDLIHFQNIPSGTQYKVIKKKLVEAYSSVPEDPGIYFFKNAKNEIIYIGKAKSLKSRVSNYFVSNAPRKPREIVRKADSLGFLVTNSELTALLSEAEMIKKQNPRLNTLLKRYSNNYFLKLSAADNFTSVKVATSFEFDGNDYYGPYPNRETVNAIKEIIDKTYQLRECDDKEFAKGRKCYLADIERCLAPCVDTNIKNTYEDELQKVHEFLRGQNQSAVNRLLNKMKELGERQKFEEAAQVRDTINAIFKQLHRASILAEPVNKANALIEISGTKNNDYVLLLEGKMFIKNFIIDEKDYFDDALENYFSATIQLIKELNEKDLERLKISLSWFVKNRSRIKIHYLKDYNSIEELAKNFLFIKKEKTSYEEIQ